MYIIDYLALMQYFLKKSLKSKKYYLCGRSAFARKAMADERRNGRAVECGGLENR